MNASRRGIVLATAVTLVLASCTGRHAGPTLTVLGAASLAGPLTALSRDFERREPGVHVRLALAGSQQLVMQLDAGAPGDVLITADERWMTRAIARHLVHAPARVVAHTTLAVVVPARDTMVRTLSDLARPGVRVVLADSSVPAGRYARLSLARLDSAPGLDPNYGARVLANVVSAEENVRQVLGKVELGEADAGIVYRSDATSAGARVRVIPIPDAYNVIARYPAAVTVSARDAALAGRFVALLVSPDGGRALRRGGLDAGDGP